MAESWAHPMEKKTWNRLSFYINIILFVVIALCIVFLILDSYQAGKLAASGRAGDLLSTAWLYVGRDIAFLSIAFALIFFQFFRNLRIIMLRSW
ncbi:MAG: hypothetical protein V1726_05280 [Methanobacteriota archaeon]